MVWEPTYALNNSDTNRVITLERTVNRLERNLRDLQPPRSATATDPHRNLP